MPQVAAQDPLIGTVLEGRYRVVGLLGRGGMGNVYEAEELRLRRRCALKVMRAELAADRANVDRFLREAQTIAQLAHKHIVDIHSFGEDESGAVFFVMELLVGEDLEARLRDRPNRPVYWREVCEWGVQVARAVGAVHEAGLIHRDLKPGNVFLARRRDGSVRVKLLDFGIVRPEDGSELTSTGATLGTPHYMSPEQIRTQAMDRRSDIYSFGVLLFKALTGRFVFRGEPIQVAMMHVEATPPAPSSLTPQYGIPPALDEIVLRCLRKRPDERFQRMEELERALLALLEDDPTHPVFSASSRNLGKAEASSVHPAASPPTGADQLPTALEAPRHETSSQPPRPVTVPPVAVAAESAAGLPPHDPVTAVQGADVPATLISQKTRAPASRRFVILGVALLAVAGLAFALTRAPDPPPGLAAAAQPSPEPKPLPVAEQTTPTPRPVEPPPAVEPTPKPAEPTPKPAATPAEAPPAKTDATPAEAPPAKTDAAPEPTRSKPEPHKRTARAEPADPRKQLARKAQACRREHDAVGGPAITIDYAIASTGQVTRSVPKDAGPLGNCLAQAVKQTTFPAKLALGQKIDL